ncbi:hypothetical protein HNR73_000537 [Phytomonospora endophytica]|uniref:Uncharacterized protein n=1 Tax=Phytomonospora endophytica TaxID=714109 RepID=A0A841FBI3_9ACTN|nr:hypothetical protein [Phytomonospora endophytica]
MSVNTPLVAHYSEKGCREGRTGTLPGGGGAGGAPAGARALALEGWGRGVGLGGGVGWGSRGHRDGGGAHAGTETRARRGSRGHRDEGGAGRGSRGHRDEGGAGTKCGEAGRSTRLAVHRETARQTLPARPRRPNHRRRGLGDGPRRRRPGAAMALSTSGILYGPPAGTQAGGGIGSRRLRRHGGHPATVTTRSAPAGVAAPRGSASHRTSRRCRAHADERRPEGVAARAGGRGERPSNVGKKRERGREA